MMFFTLRAGCSRAPEYIKLVASDVQPIANYYSFRWAPKIVRTLDDLRDPMDLYFLTKCFTRSPDLDNYINRWTPPARRADSSVANWSMQTFESEAA